MALMILADSETKVDLLNSEAIALTIIRVLQHRPDRPVTLGVHGDWGAGKSSVLEMIEASLDGQDGVLCIKFNGWRFQGFEDAKIALIEGIVTALVEERPLLVKAKGALANLLERIDILKLAKRGGGLIWNATTGLPSPDQIGSAISALGRFADNPGDLVSKENAEQAAKNLGGLLKPAEQKRIPHEVEEFRKAFDDLLKEADVKQLVVLVDDLDRCLPEIAIETLEAIRLFVFTKNTAFVVGADEAMIEYAVRKHFPDFPGTTGPHDYARNYLEKLIQVPFRIPALGEPETRIYISLLLIGSVVGEDDPDFQRLIDEGRERLKRPWASKPLDTKAVNAALGAKTPPVLEMLAVSDQIGPILASGSKGNPRQIKRFLNALLLRKAIAEARGFGDEVKLPVLAKLMLAERYVPGLFEQIAISSTGAANGRCKELAVFEAIIEQKKQKPQKGSTAAKKEPTSDDTMVTGWLVSEATMNWASLKPELAEIDLRPYLFVAKDKKDYFVSSSALGKLADIVANLMGDKLAVSKIASEIEHLAPPDASAVFDELRQAVINQDSYTTKPAGIEGMLALVKAHANLEEDLLDFLDALPTAKLGVWAIGGWEAQDPALRARQVGVYKRWAESESASRAVKTAAGLAVGR